MLLGYIAYMSASVPDWLLPQPTSQLPAWLTPAPQAAPAVANLPDWLVPARKERNERSRLAPGNAKPEMREMILADFEMAFPRVLDRMCAGETITDSIAQLPFRLDRGAFMRWVKKDAQKYAMFKEAKEIRSEVWAGDMVNIALGKSLSGEPIPMDLDRAKVVLDTYKFLIRCENKKEYGDTKQVEITQTISVRAALDAAKTRVFQAQTEPDDDVIDVTPYKMLAEPVDAEFEDED